MILLSPATRPSPPEQSHQFLPEAFGDAEINQEVDGNVESEEEVRADPHPPTGFLREIFGRNELQIQFLSERINDAEAKDDGDRRDHVLEIALQGIHGGGGGIGGIGKTPSNPVDHEDYR